MYPFWKLLHPCVSFAWPETSFLKNIGRFYLVLVARVLYLCVVPSRVRHCASAVENWLIIPYLIKLLVSGYVYNEYVIHNLILVGAGMMSSRSSRIQNGRGHDVSTLQFIGDLSSHNKHNMTYIMFHFSPRGTHDSCLSAHILTYGSNGANGRFIKSTMM